MPEQAPHQSAAPVAATNPPRAVASATPAPHERPPSAVEVRALTKTYPGGVEAVRGIDFDVEVGDTPLADRHPDAPQARVQLQVCAPAQADIDDGLLKDDAAETARDQRRARDIVPR